MDIVFSFFILFHSLNIPTLDYFVRHIRKPSIVSQVIRMLQLIRMKRKDEVKDVKTSKVGFDEPVIDVIADKNFEASLKLIVRVFYYFFKFLRLVLLIVIQ